MKHGNTRAVPDFPDFPRFPHELEAHRLKRSRQKIRAFANAPQNNFTPS